MNHIRNWGAAVALVAALAGCGAEQQQPPIQQPATTQPPASQSAPAANPAAGYADLV
jgi:hypothetical protein